tara:strand:+ start:593 stop:1057 length:465 start_codon:yes stop_codon:yes gene_type:complete
MNVGFICNYNLISVSKPTDDIDDICLKNNQNLSKLFSNKEVNFFMKLIKIREYNFLISLLYKFLRKYSSKTNNIYRLKAINKEESKKNEQYMSTSTINKSLKIDFEGTLNKVINIFHTYIISLTFSLNNIFDLKDEIKSIAFKELDTTDNSFLK